MVASRTMPALSLRDRGLAPVAAATFVVACALLVWALFFGGADSPTRLAWIGGAAVLAASVLVAAGFAGLVVRPRLGRAAAWCIACLAAFVVWQGASIVWSVLPDNSWDYLNRGLAYLAFLVLGLLRRGARAACASRDCCCARGARRVRDRATRSSRRGSRRSIPTTGGSRGFARRSDSGTRSRCSATSRVVLGLWRAAERRFDGALLVFGGVLTVLLAYSRGGILVGVVAAGAWLWLDSRRLEALAALVVGGGAAVAVFGVSLALHGVSDDGQPHSARAHDGRLFLLAVVVAALVRRGRRAASCTIVEPDERAVARRVRSSPSSASRVSRASSSQR